jgi:hypothetical protein
MVVLLLVICFVLIFLSFSLLFFFFFFERVLICSLDDPWSYTSSTSASWVLGLQAWTDLPSLLLIFGGTSILFSTKAVLIYSPMNSAQGFHLPHRLLSICVLPFLMPILTVMRFYLIAALFKHVLKYSLAVVFFHLRMCIQIKFPFFNWIICFLLGFWIPYIF